MIPPTYLPITYPIHCYRIVYTDVVRLHMISFNNMQQRGWIGLTLTLQAIAIQTHLIS